VSICDGLTVALAVAAGVAEELELEQASSTIPAAAAAVTASTPRRVKYLAGVCMGFSSGRFFAARGRARECRVPR
jgi:hypothetical protein